MPKSITNDNTRCYRNRSERKHILSEAGVRRPGEGTSSSTDCVRSRYFEKEIPQTNQSSKRYTKSSEDLKSTTESVGETYSKPLTKPTNRNAAICRQNPLAYNMSTTNACFMIPQVPPSFQQSGEISFESSSLEMDTVNTVKQILESQQLSDSKINDEYEASTSSKSCPTSRNSTNGEVQKRESASPIKKSPKRRRNDYGTPRAPRGNNDASRKRRSSPKNTSSRSEKREQASKSSRVSILNTKKKVSDSPVEDDSYERRSPLVRGKTRSRTRYFSKVGAIYSPPQPADYSSCRTRPWPVNISAPHCRWPSVCCNVECELPGPTDDTVDVYCALHHSLSLVAFNIAATHRRQAVSLREISVMRLMLDKLVGSVRNMNAAGIPTANPSQNEPIDNANVTLNDENEIQTEGPKVNSPPEMSNFFQTLELSKQVIKIESHVPKNTEQILSESINDLLQSISNTLHQYSDYISQCNEREGCQEESTSASGIKENGGGFKLDEFLKRLLLATSMLYSLKCDIPHDNVTVYINSHTPERIIRWIDEHFDSDVLV